MKRQATVLLSGMIAADPWQGGATWAVLQYILGLRRLGHEVYLVEPVVAQAVRPAGAALAASENADYFRQVMREYGLGDQAALLLAGTRETVGLPYETLRRVARRADLLLNLSGLLTDESLVAPIATRVYLDIDPAFNQLWHAVQGIDRRFDAHTHFVTIGLELGEPDCPVPTCGRSWLKTLPPVVLDHWPRAASVTYDGLTTIANWRSYGSIEHNGVLYGQKVHSFRPFFALPTRTTERFLVALAIHPDEASDLAALRSNGWELLDPARVAGTPHRYRQFIRASKAEFGIAKSGYVAARCGWFSDRSVCYLASGRPVIAQETGFSRRLPTGEGLLTFATFDDVLAALEQLRAHYPRHAARARAIAVDCFDSDKVLARLLEEVGL